MRCPTRFPGRAVCLTATIMLCGWQAAASLRQPQTVPPRLYELQINGESFEIEVDRQYELTSTESPEVKYSVALRLSREQVLTLDTLKFRYDAGFFVTEDRDAEFREVLLEHELGFTVTLADLAAKVQAGRHRDVLKQFVAATRESLAGVATELKESEPYERSWESVDSLGVTLSYSDSAGESRRCLVFLIGNRNLTALLTAYYPADAEADVLPLLSKILDSIQEPSPPEGE